MDTETEAANEEKNGGKTPNLKTRRIASQIAASCSKYIIMLDIGMAICYPTIAIPPMLEAMEGLSIDKSEASWFASLVFVWQPVGSLASIPMSGLGRKNLMLYLQLPLLIGWLVPYFATSVWELYFASSCLGLGIGFMQAPIATYIGEVTQPQYRGWLASIAYCCLTLGQVVIYVIDVIVGSWRVSALYGAAMPPLTAIVLYLIPESPVWLVSQGRLSEAKKSLKWLRGWINDAEIEEEYQTILYNYSPQYASLVNSQNDPTVLPITNVEDQYRKGQSEETLDIKKGEQIQEKENMPFHRYLLEPEMYKPIILSLVYFYMSNGIAIAVMRSYLVLIFQELRVEMNEYIVLVGVTTIGFIANIICVIVMPLVKKRVLTFSAGIACTIGVFGLGFYTLFGLDLDQKWIPIAFMVELFFATSLAIGHLPWILISEIFPLRGRTFASGLVAGLANFMQFLGIKLFWTYVSWFTLGGTFIMYGFFFILILTYLYFFQVETEGRTLEDIANEFKYGKNYKRLSKQNQPQPL